MIRTPFLPLAVKLWPKHDYYQWMKEIIENLKVVNDPAERGIHLTKQLKNNLSYDSNERQKLFVCIPHLRKKLHNMKKLA